MRQQITQGFRAPVFEMYDSHEFNLLAWECSATGEMHISDYGMILEVLRDGRPVREGERGEVVGTNLYAYTMPFIRYRLGDIVTKGSEVCRLRQPLFYYPCRPGTHDRLFHTHRRAYGPPL